MSIIIEFRCFSFDRIIHGSVNYAAVYDAKKKKKSNYMQILAHNINCT